MKVNFARVYLTWKILLVRWTFLHLADGHCILPLLLAPLVSCYFVVLDGGGGCYFFRSYYRLWKCCHQVGYRQNSYYNLHHTWNCTNCWYIHTSRPWIDCYDKIFVNCVWNRLPKRKNIKLFPIKVFVIQTCVAILLLFWCGLMNTLKQLEGFSLLNSIYNISCISYNNWFWRLLL